MPNLFIDIEARFAKFQDSLDQIQRAAQQTVGSISKSFSSLKGLTAGLGAVVGINSIASFIGSIGQAAIEAEQADARLNIVLRNIGDASGITREKVEQLSVELSRIGKFDDDDIKSAAAELLKFGNISEVVFADALRAAKGVALFFGEDLRSAAQKVAKALADPESAFKLLKEAGVSFSDSQKEVFKTLGQTQGIFAQQKAIVTELASRYGDLDEELSQGLTGTIDELNKSWKELLESFGLTASKLGPVTQSLSGVRVLIDAIRGPVDRLSAAPKSGGIIGTPIEEAVPDVGTLRRNQSKIFLPGSKTPISEIIPGSAASPIQQTPAFRAAPILSEDERRRLQSSAGASNREIILPSEKTADPTKEKKSKGVSDFDSLRRSLVSQLQSEKKLTEELTLLEDERYSRLAPAQQRQLRGIALTIDAIRQEKTNRESIDSATSAEASIREESLRTELDAIERRKLVLSQSYEDSKLSAQAYYTAVARAETESTLLRIANLRQIADAQEEIADDPDRSNDEQLNAKVRLASIQREIIELTREQADIATRTERAIRQADEETLRRKIEIAQQVNQAQGIQNPELDRAALLDQFKDLPADFKQSLTFKIFIDTKLAQQQIDEFERNAGVVEQTLRVKEERIAVDQESGIKTSSEARSSIVDARKTAVVELEELVSKYEDVRRASGTAFGPEQQARLDTLKTKLEELRLTADEYTLAFKQIGEGPTQQFFEDFLSGTVSASDAFDSFVKSVQANLLKLAAEDITKKIFSAINPSEEGGGLSGLIGGAAKFLGFGGASQQKPPAQQLPASGGGIGLQAPAAQVGQGLLSFGAGLLESKDDSGTGAISEAAKEAAASLSGLKTESQNAETGLGSFAGTFDSFDIVGKLFEYFTSTTAAQVGTQALATATTTAAIQIQIAGSTAAASSFSADGNVFSGGYQIPFAKGGAFDDGQIQAFATGGIVSKPTTFPIKGGKTGLMGEAGPEAIMPLTRGQGGFAVYAVDADGQETTLSIARNSQGKLAVKLPSAEGGPAFAKGAPFQHGKPSTVTAFAQGGAFLAGEPQEIRFADGGVIVQAAAAPAIPAFPALPTPSLSIALGGTDVAIDSQAPQIIVNQRDSRLQDQVSQRETLTESKSREYSRDHSESILDKTDSYANVDRRQVEADQEYSRFNESRTHSAAYDWSVADSLNESFAHSSLAASSLESFASATTKAVDRIASAVTAEGGDSYSYSMAFAKGDVFEREEVQAFARGGIVSRPTTFPMAAGRTGLMGESGPEAIMPLTSGAGGFAVYAVDSAGNNTTLNILRNAAGKMAVQLPSMEGGTIPAGEGAAAPAFALGGAFTGGIENYVMKFADGGVFTSTANNMASLNAQTISSQSSSIQSAIHSNQSRLDVLPFKAYAYGGIANKPQLAMFGEGSRPEAFVPLPDGKTIPVTMDAMGAGVTVIQNISTPDAQSFRRSRAAIFNDVQAGLSTSAAKS